MFEKVNPSHPDKIADRIAGAIVDLAYCKDENPKVAVEVLIGHGVCHIINETSETFKNTEIQQIVDRIAGAGLIIDYVEVQQDKHLADNQIDKIRCGDNGIFKGEPITQEELALQHVAKVLYWKYNSDGKYIIRNNTDLIICQSHATKADIQKVYDKAIINPLGDWTGGIYVDTGATNRKLGSDMGSSITGGGLHGKDLSKADVSINIYLYEMAQICGEKVTASCAIGDEYVIVNTVNGAQKIEYKKIVDYAKRYINKIGGFEKFAEWGLIR